MKKELLQDRRKMKKPLSCNSILYLFFLKHTILNKYILCLLRGLLMGCSWFFLVYIPDSAHLFISILPFFYHSPKAFWCAPFPNHVALPPNLDHQCLFSHTATLYHVPRQPHVHIVSPPSYCNMFSHGDIRRAVRFMSNNKVADKEGWLARPKKGEEGLQFEFLKHGIHSLDSHIADLFNHVVFSGLPPSWSHHIIHPFLKWGLLLTPTITEPSWLDTLLPSSIAQYFICGYQMSSRGGPQSQRIGRILLGISYHWPHLHSSGHYWGGKSLLDHSIFLSLYTYEINQPFGKLVKVLICPTKALGRKCAYLHAWTGFAIGSRYFSWVIPAQIYICAHPLPPRRLGRLELNPSVASTNLGLFPSVRPDPYWLTSYSGLLFT